MALRFEQSQSMKLGQSMKLAPRVIQSMEILQMPIAELQERIEQELENNATLEIVERIREERTEPRDAPSSEREGDATEDFARLDRFEQDSPDAAENAYESRPERPSSLDSYEPRRRDTSDRDAKSEAMANTPARSASLHEQLLDQWSLCEVDETTRELGRRLIRSLDEDGFLRTPLTEAIGDDETAQAMDPEDALRAVQLLLDPAGVAARDHRECLLLQLDVVEEESAGEFGFDEDDASALRTARILIEDHLDDLAQNRVPKITKATGLSADDIREGVAQLRRLSLAPARGLVDTPTAAVTPDAVVEYDEESDRYIAYLSDRRMPQLAINREYALMAKDRTVEKKDRDFLKVNMSNAQWLIDAVEQRKQTLLRVLRVVVDAQRDYFDEGPESLRPLPMTQVAEQLGIHVATVSRAVADKWIETPRGVVALRGFFTGGMQTESGEEVSYDAIKAALKDIVEGEDPKKPFSDEALVRELKSRGIEIARRTVAKYRGQLGLQSARLRKRFD